MSTNYIILYWYLTRLEIYEQKKKKIVDVTLFKDAMHVSFCQNCLHLTY